MRLVSFGIAAICLAAVPARAQDQPVLAPLHDATIDYQIDAGNRPGTPRTMRMMFSAGGQQTRIDGIGRPGYMVLDRAGHRMMIVMEEAKRYLERPLDPGRTAFALPDNIKFSRGGSETIAGLKCTVWQSTGEHQGSACVTDDGMVLRGDSVSPQGEHTRLVATAVKVAPIAPEMFGPPAGFAKMDIPLPPGTPGHPGAPPRP